MPLDGPLKYKKLNSKKHETQQESTYKTAQYKQLYNRSFIKQQAPDY